MCFSIAIDSFPQNRTGSVPSYFLSISFTAPPCHFDSTRLCMRRNSSEEKDISVPSFFKLEFMFAAQLACNNRVVHLLSYRSSSSSVRTFRTRFFFSPHSYVISSNSTRLLILLSFLSLFLCSLLDPTKLTISCLTDKKCKIGSSSGEKLNMIYVL